MFVGVLDIFYEICYTFFKIFNIDYRCEMMTKLLVLAILDMKAMSGYDIQQMMQTTDAQRWGAVQVGSIYHALKKLEHKGYITISSVEQTGHRQKVVYQITDQGRVYLKELVREALESPALTYPSALYAGLSFYEQLSDDEVSLALQEQENKLDREEMLILQGWEQKREALNNQISPMVQLIFDHMLAMIRSQRDFIKQAQDYLQTEEK